MSDTLAKSPVMLTHLVMCKSSYGSTSNTTQSESPVWSRSPSNVAVTLYLPIGRPEMFDIVYVPLTTSTSNVALNGPLKVTVTVPFRSPHAPSVREMMIV